jgi:phosphoglycerate dehydrogenase-like enzyme
MPVSPTEDGLPIAVAPVGTRDYVRKAAVAGGGRLVDIAEARALIWTASSDPVGLSETLDAFPAIEWVQLPWAGVEPYARAGIFDDKHVWTCGKGVYAQPVAEHALMLALAGMRELRRFACARSWQQEAGISLHGGRVTIFGGGGIAHELVKLLQPFECSITVVRNRDKPIEGADRVIVFDERYEALAGADVVFLALALTPKTERLITQVELELMEPHAWLVNVARGAHVDTEDLVVALRGDVIGGAALDVTDPEPLPEGHPLWALPNCLITPHTGNTEDMTVPLLGARITENVRRYRAGEELLGVVDPDRGY